TAYATEEPWPPVPFWELLFKNIRVFFLGSDDFPAEAKAAAARDLNAALEAKWPGFETIETFALSAIAEAHEYVESRKRSNSPRPGGTTASTCGSARTGGTTAGSCGCPRGGRRGSGPAGPRRCTGTATAAGGPCSRSGGCGRSPRPSRSATSATTRP